MVMLIDVIFLSMIQAYAERETTNALNRSRTYDLPSISSDGTHTPVERIRIFVFRSCLSLTKKDTYHLFTRLETYHYIPQFQKCC